MKLHGILCHTSKLIEGALKASELNIPMFYYRDKPKAHGLGLGIEGDLKIMAECKYLLHFGK